MSEPEIGYEVDSIALDHDLDVEFRILDAGKSIPVQAMVIEAIDKGREIDVVIADHMWQAEQVAHDFKLPVSRMREVCKAGLFHYLEVNRGI